MHCDNHQRIEDKLVGHSKIMFNHESRISSVEGWIKVNTAVVILGFVSIVATLLFG